MEISLREVTKDNWLDVIHLQISQIPECKIISILYMPGHHAMRDFYARFGFVVTEEDENDGVVMELKVRD